MAWKSIDINTFFQFHDIQNRDFLDSRFQFLVSSRPVPITTKAFSAEFLNYWHAAYMADEEQIKFLLSLFPETAHWLALVHLRRKKQIHWTYWWMLCTSDIVWQKNLLKPHSLLPYTLACGWRFIWEPCKARVPANLICKW